MPPPVGVRRITVLFGYAVGDAAGTAGGNSEFRRRRLALPDDFLRTLSWGSAPSAAIILAEGLKAEAERG